MNADRWIVRYTRPLGSPAEDWLKTREAAEAKQSRLAAKGIASEIYRERRGLRLIVNKPDAFRFLRTPERV